MMGTPVRAKQGVKKGIKKYQKSPFRVLKNAALLRFSFNRKWLLYNSLCCHKKWMVCVVFVFCMFVFVFLNPVLCGQFLLVGDLVSYAGL
jgi:hypothetical protein